MKTKEKILVKARELFNEQGYGKVKIADIADALNISPGNLWYHFKARDDIFSELSYMFIIEARERIKISPKGESIVIEFAEFLDVIAQECDKHKFLYRDKSDYGEYSEKTQEALPEVFIGTQRQYQNFINEMRTQGFMTLKEEDVADLAETLCIILRYSSEFLRESKLSFGSEVDDHIHSYGLQCFVLDRFMTPEAAKKLRKHLFELIEKRHGSC